MDFFLGERGQRPRQLRRISSLVLLFDLNHHGMEINTTIFICSTVMRRGKDETGGDVR